MTWLSPAFLGQFSCFSLARVLRQRCVHHFSEAPNHLKGSVFSFWGKKCFFEQN